MPHSASTALDRPNALRRAALALLVPLLLLLGCPAGAATARDARACASTLDCSAAELDALPMAERLVFVRAVQDRVAAEYIPGFRHWRNIEGIVRFFAENSFGAPGSWVSHVDAGILEGIERGTAIALGVSADGFGNPGSPLWAEYLRRLHDGELTDRWVHDPAWGNAEQASTEHGVRIAEAHGARPSRVDRDIYEFSELYRWMLRNPQQALLALNQASLDTTGLPVPPADFLRWFTDVTISEPTYRGAHVARDIALPDPVSAPFSAAQLLLAYAPELLGAGTSAN
ncbi:MAG: hypothetical protein IJH84_25510 [Saccharopolyspora sp.]|uniref:hypothetical protein n=1 Tax=unclassified Saccharopolyspora TaxID=2646250 RepID=UPI0025D3C71E|nr:hypothetical protein [Saccharopolyspora sp.]MBQ6644368.1 hypothetical protein [Saccharopolyspora sp.]